MINSFVFTRLIAPTLFCLMVLFGAQPAQAQMDCGDFWEEGGPSASAGGAFPCIEFTPSDSSLIVGPGTDHRMFYDANWTSAGATPPDAFALLDNMAVGFDRSVRHYQGLGLSVFPIYFMIGEGIAEDYDDWPYIGLNWDASASVPYLDGWVGGPCPITSFNLAFIDLRESGADNVKQLAAHEVFHCFQWFNFDDLINERDDNNWLKEGTAEYFSSEVFQCANAEHGFAINYDADKDVVEQSYETSVFFHHLANVSGMGEDGIIGLIRQQTGGPRADQRRDLASVAGMNDNFHEFGKDYIDDDIPDCGGLMPVRSLKGELQIIEEEGEVAVSAEAFHIARYRVELKKGRKYQISRIGEEGSGRLSWRRDDDPTSWEEVPSEIEIPCDDSRSRHIVATTTQDGEPYKLTLRFEAEEDEGKRCCVDTGEQDQCIIGSWRADDQAMARWLSSVFYEMNTESSTTTLDSFSADARFAADEFGGVRGTISDARGAGEMRRSRPGGGKTVTEFEIAGGGTSLSRWSTEGNRTLYLCPRESDVSFTMTVTGEFGSFSMPIGPPTEKDTGALTGAEFAYQCSASEITIMHEMPGLPTQQYRATKISE